MITTIKINGFKSFSDFQMTFTPLTVIAGINASGKSNLFDAFKLLSRLAETDLRTAFSEQRGNPDELFTQIGEDKYAEEMSFTVDMLLNRKVKDNWGGEVELNNTRLRYTLKIRRSKNSFGFQGLQIYQESLEKIKPSEDSWSKQMIPRQHENLWKSLRSGGSKEPFIKTEPEGDTVAIRIRQDGGGHGKATPASVVSQTVLGGINSVDFPHAFAVKEEMRNWKFLQLNPEDLREPTRQDAGIRDEITSTGKNLAAALFRIKSNDLYALKEISRKLNAFLPGFTDVDVFDDKANRQYIIKLKGEDNKYFSSRVLSEGTLRILTLCILEFDEKYTGLLCFEEPENGIHPYRIAATADLLRDLSTNFSDEINFSIEDRLLRQVIVNTHSPVLISSVVKLTHDKNISVWFSKQNILIAKEYGDKVKLKVTRVAPVDKMSKNGTQLLLPLMTEEERRLTIAEAIKYLNTADAEETIKTINDF